MLNYITKNTISELVQKLFQKVVHDSNSQDENFQNFKYRYVRCSKKLFQYSRRNRFYRILKFNECF